MATIYCKKGILSILILCKITNNSENDASFSLSAPYVDGARLDVLNSEPDIKFSVSRGIDADRGIRYNEDIDIPYRETKQLREYIMSENNRNNSELKPTGCKEIGTAFIYGGTEIKSILMFLCRLR